MKKTLLFTMTLLLVLSLTGGPARAREVRFGHIAPVFHGQHLGTVAFADYVTQKTNGAIKINIFPMGQLGPEMSLAEQVQTGTLEMASVTTAVLQNFVPQAALLDLPFVFPNRETAYAVLDDPEFQDRFFATFESKGLVAIGYTENEFRDITNSKRPIHKPADLKGLKIRVMKSPVYLDTFNQLGASAVPMAFPEIYNALQQGVIDGQENPIYTSILMKFTEVNKHVTLTKHILTECIIILNADFWKSLTPGEQKIFREAASACIKQNREVTASHFRKLPKLDLSIEEFLQKNNIQTISLSEAERAEFSQAMHPIWTKYKKFCGPDIYDFFMNKIKAKSK
ncbi:MAG: DctP family TRAP transporter solute-binding subunit [Proteobacteria bacterium]|nr:DctP family TRAP transporter solute-binding subunit [Pseudomonadota bacterium]